MNGFHIRIALPQDIPAISTIEDNSFSSPYPESLLIRLLNDHPDSFFVACNELGKLVGYCVGTLRGKLGHLISIAVSDESRGQGVAKMLLDRLAIYLAEKDAAELWLEVNPENTEAMALYTKFGFRQIEFVENYYADGTDALRMRLMVEKPMPDAKQIGVGDDP